MRRFFEYYLEKIFGYHNGSKVKNIDASPKYHDIFGNPIDANDAVMIVKYNDLRRRGYITLDNRGTAKTPLAKDTTEKERMKGMIKLDDISCSHNSNNELDNPRIKWEHGYHASKYPYKFYILEHKNGEFFHLYPYDIKDVLPQYVK